MWYAKKTLLTVRAWVAFTLYQSNAMIKQLECVVFVVCTQRSRPPRWCSGTQLRLRSGRPGFDSYSGRSNLHSVANDSPPLQRSLTCKQLCAQALSFGDGPNQLMTPIRVVSEYKKI